MLKAQRRSLLLIPLLAAATVSYTAAFLLRFEFALPKSMEGLFRLGFFIFLPLKAASLWAFRVHTARWRMAGVIDLCRLTAANLTASALIIPVAVLIVGVELPRSVYILDAALCLLATAVIQLTVRAYWELFMLKAAENGHSKGTLIYGAGACGLMLGKEIRANLKLKTKILGFLDDDERKQGSSLSGIPVLGRGHDAARIVARLARKRTPVTEIVIAMPSATAPQMRAAVGHCRDAGIPFKTLPGLAELLQGEIISKQIRDVSLNDLLGREPVLIDENRIEHELSGEVILVTGGCGSIGSELCRQIARFEPRKLVIFDQAESGMYMLALDLRKWHPQLELITEIGDIVRASRVKEVLTRHAVTAVFHAAAYKHVPLMEDNIREAVQNNILGTYCVARWAHWAGVKKFVLISSDKAVNPTSIMGVTKRIAEQIVSAIPLDGSARTGGFVSVRFGNVLGSSGSVIPIFQQQIAAGGPVTVTHPEMRRYFMSVSEAVQLVLQAATMGEQSEVFVLDMGEPARIIDLATNMIRLAGLVPGEDIDIRITGLRPGEKLYEELQLDHEDILPTLHEKIKRFRSEPPDSPHIAQWMKQLKRLLVRGNRDALKAHLLTLVPEYRGNAYAPAAREPESPKLVAAGASE
jgi:FlaA1/EpsC-like NDP-sugar epimerase